jgi:predicted Fe-Mo cluster-binding NifX family protein
MRMVILATLTGKDTVGGGFGRADRVAVARPQSEGGFQVEEIEVGWGEKHDQHADGLHHAMIAKFLQEQAVDKVVTGHMGEGMRRMLGSMKISVVESEGPLGTVLEQATEA